MTFDLGQLSFIITSIAIHPRHRHRHHHCRHHHHHHPFLLVSSLLPSFMPRCRLVFYACTNAVSFFEAKLVLQFFRSIIRTNLQILQRCNVLLFNVLGTLPGQLFLDTLLDACLSEPCLGNCSWEPILRNLLLGALPDNLFLGTFSWEPVLGNFACLLQTCSLGPCSGTYFS